MSEKHLIWSNEPDLSEENLARIRKDFEEQEIDVTSEDQLVRAAYDETSDWLDNEAANLAHALDGFRPGSRILMYGTLGLWHGRVSGYKILTGTGIRDIFGSSVGDFVEFYCQDGELRCRDTHHDGTNEYVYRELLDPDTDEMETEQDELLDQLASNARTWPDDKFEKAMARHTRSLWPAIQAVYGWTDEKEPENAERTENT